MSQCWLEGDWRAFVDGELPVEEMARGREHLASCAACAGLHGEIAGRAARVSALLLELDGAPVVLRPAVASRAAWKWAAGLAAAAALITAFAMAPKRAQVVETPRVAQSAASPAVAASPVTPVMARRGVPARRRRHTPQAEYFLAFDDEPIDTGTVMRVALDGGIEADVIVDGSGRPRAIRAIH